MKTLSASASIVLALATLAAACAPPDAAEGKGSQSSRIKGEGDGSDGSDEPTDPALMRAVLTQMKEDAIALDIDTATDEGATNDETTDPATTSDATNVDGKGEATDPPPSDDGNDSAGGKGGGIGTKSLRFATVTSPAAASGTPLVDTEHGRIAGQPACSHMRSLRGALEHPFFFAGIVASGGRNITIGGGKEAVVDVYNRQAAVYQFASGGISSAVSISAGLYSGVAFDSTARAGASALDAVWRGHTESFTLEAGAARFFGANATGFRSQDQTVFGGAVGASVGIGASIFGPVTASVASAQYSIDTTATRAIFGGSGRQVALSRLDVITRVRQVSGGMTLGNPAVAGGIDVYVLSILALKEHHATAEALCR